MRVRDTGQQRQGTSDALSPTTWRRWVPLSSSSSTSGYFPTPMLSQNLKPEKGQAREHGGAAPGPLALIQWSGVQCAGLVCGSYVGGLFMAGLCMSLDPSDLQVTYGPLRRTLTTEPQHKAGSKTWRTPRQVFKISDTPIFASIKWEACLREL